jgi:GNAT superfamily N-acetyltransferase
MSLRVDVDVTRDLPFKRLQPLFAESAAQGWDHLNRLYAEWQQGLNRFAREGEALYLAQADERIIGVGGVSLDPYAASPRIGRVRRVYVLEGYRRRGVGRMLMDRAMREARQSFTELRLRAGSARAAAFFEALGFEATAHVAQATHRLWLP